MAKHTVELSTEELIFIVAAIKERHAHFLRAHKKIQDKGNAVSPYYASIAYLADGFETLNDALPDESRLPEALARNPGGS